MPGPLNMMLGRSLLRVVRLNGSAGEVSRHGPPGPPPTVEEIARMRETSDAYDSDAARKLWKAGQPARASFTQGASRHAETLARNTLAVFDNRRAAVPESFDEWTESVEANLKGMKSHLGALSKFDEWTESAEANLKGMKSHLGALSKSAQESASKAAMRAAAWGALAAGALIGSGVLMQQGKPLAIVALCAGSAVLCARWAFKAHSEADLLTDAAKQSSLSSGNVGVVLEELGGRLKVHREARAVPSSEPAMMLTRR